MSIQQRFLELGEYLAAGLYEEPNRSLFYRKALGLRRFYEHLTPPEYTGKPLYPSGAVRRDSNIPVQRDSIVYDSYFLGVSWDPKRLPTELHTALQMDFGRYEITIDPEHSVAGAMYNHSMPNYERILAEGLNGYEVRVHGIQDSELREGLLHLLAGLRTYVGNCVAYLDTVGASSALIEALRRVPFAPARTFYEAIVCWNFVLYLDNVDNLGCVATGLSPYYQGEDALPLLDNLFDNLDACCGYSMALPPEKTPLTIPCLQAARGRRRPMIEFFVDEHTPLDLWEEASKTVRSGGGQPAFYNPEILQKGLQRRFPEIPDEDVRRFCGGGCTESMLAGLSNVESLAAGINLALLLSRAIQKYLPGCSTYEEFYRAFLSDVTEISEKIKKQISECQLARREFNPLPMRTLLTDDCIDSGLEYNAGGARYRWSVVNFAGTINVIDSLLVIRDLVFREKAYAPGEFAALLAQDDNTLVAQGRTHRNCFGRDNLEANQEAARISADIFATLDEGAPALGMGYLPASIQFAAAAASGKQVGATPDGRHAGDPLCESLGAINGKDTLGPTAMLQSVASLNLQRALGTPVVNLTISPDFDPTILRGLVLGYMQLGGAQLQITCVDREILLDAYAHPEAHQNLIIRVGGYSEYFCRLPEDLQRSIISRTVHQVG